MKKYENVLYVRVSSDEQREAKTIESQLSESLSAMKARGIVIDRIYKDDGVTGKIPLSDRPQDGRLLWADIMAGNVGTVWAWALDRVGRKLRDFLNLLEEFKQHGTGINIIPWNIPPGPVGMMLMQVMGAVAELEHATILERTRRGLMQKVKRGESTGEPKTFGYKVVSDRPVIVEPEAVIIRDLFERAAAGATCPKLAEHLNRLGVPVPRRVIAGKFVYSVAGRWTRTTVRGILTNVRYKGEWPYHQKDQVIERSCPAIVSAELWERVQDRLKSHRLATQARTEYLLAGLIKCVCGKTYGGRGYAYSCGGRHECHAPIMRRKELEDTVWGQCELYISYPGEALKDLEHQMASSTTPARNFDAEKRREEEKLAGFDKGLDEARIMWQMRATAKEPYTKEQHERDMHYYVEKRNAVLMRLAEIEQEAEVRRDKARALGEVKSVLEQLRWNVKAGTFSFEQKCAIVTALVSKIVITPLPADAEALGMEQADQVEITYRFSLGNLFERARRERWPPSPPLRHMVPEDDATLKAGADALSVVLSATPAACRRTSLQNKNGYFYLMTSISTAGRKSLRRWGSVLRGRLRYL
jgi:site-specific DNA recombinase